MFCTRCGTPVSEDDRFCRKCGAQLDVPQMPSDTPVNDSNEGHRRTSAPNKERRTAPPENEKMKIILPLAILTIVLFAFIIVLIVLLNRPEPEPAPRTSSHVSSVESASIEPETTTTTEEPTTETTTEPPTEMDRILIQDLAAFSNGEIRAEAPAVSENNISIVYYPAETGGDMYYCVLEWISYLKRNSKLSYVGASGSDVLYTTYYDCSDSNIEKKKTKVDGKTKKQEYVLSLVVVNDPNSNAVLSVTANMAKGVNVSDLDLRYSGEKVTTTSATVTTTTATTKKTTKKTTASTQKVTTVKTTSDTQTSKKLTETIAAPADAVSNTYLQDFGEFAGRCAKGGNIERGSDIDTVTYEPSGSESNFTDAVNMWIQNIFDESDFSYVGISEKSGHIIYYFDYDSGRKNKPEAEMENSEGKQEYSLEIDCLCNDTETITKITIKTCHGIITVDMGERY